MKKYFFAVRLRDMVPVLCRSVPVSMNTPLTNQINLPFVGLSLSTQVNLIGMSSCQCQAETSKTLVLSDAIYDFKLL